MHNVKQELGPEACLLHPQVCRPWRHHWAPRAPVPEEREAGGNGPGVLRGLGLGCGAVWW